MQADVVVSSFRLIENQHIYPLSKLRLSLKKILTNANINDALVVRGQTAQAVMLGLLAAFEERRCVYLVRDAAVMPLSTEWSEGQEWQLIANESCISLPNLWLQTSGTTGRPKWVAYAPYLLSESLRLGTNSHACWLLTYDPASFAGLQVMLSALLGGHTLISTHGIAKPAAMLEMVNKYQVSHVSGTPTFWRSFARAAKGEVTSVKHITLGGELADQPTLDMLSRHFPHSRIRHIYATTETGVVFSVQDGRAGFPRSWINTTQSNGIRLAISDHGTLLVSSSRTRVDQGNTMVDTGDVVELDGERAFFKGRIDNVINVGGQKIFPEKVEEHLLRLPFVGDVRVSARPSPITGYILIADIVPREGYGSAEHMKSLIREHLKTLPRYAQPALLRFKDELRTATSYKKARST